MKRTFLAILLLAAATPWGGAVETASGKLSTVIGEDAVSVTELSLTGTMDARDFKYISDSMPQLSVLDISGVTIEEYSDREPLFANFTYYPAGELPKYSLMGKPLTSVSLPSTLTIHRRGGVCRLCRTDRNQPSVYGRHDRQLCIFKCVKTCGCQRRRGRPHDRRLCVQPRRRIDNGCVAAAG